MLRNLNTKRAVIAFIFTLIATNLLFAQELPKTIDNEKKNTFLFTPINLFDIINPSIQIGYERLLTKRFAYQIEAAYIIHHSVEESIIDWASGIKDCEYTNKGFKIRNELKFIFLKRRKINLYSSVEAFYLQNRSGVVGTFQVSDTTFQYSSPRPDGANAYDDFFVNDKQKIGLNLKFGLKFFPKSKGFMIEPHIGFGIAYRKTRQYDRENLNDDLFDDFLSADLKNGNMWVFSFPLNLKLGYRF